MTGEILHRGYRIIAESYKGDKGKWIPRARIVPEQEAMNPEERPFSWPRTFDTEQDADDFALQAAQLYIDENY